MRRSGIILLLLLLSIINYKKIYCDEINPVYSVTISMPERVIWSSKKVNVSISIVGMGSFELGAVGIQSDNDNILVNTYWLQQTVFGPEIFEEGPKIGPAEKKETLTNNVVLSLAPISMKEKMQQNIMGNFQITTKNITPSKYRLKVSLFIQSNGANYIYSDYVEYDVVTFWEKYSSNILTFIISFTSSVIFFEYKSRREKRIIGTRRR